MIGALKRGRSSFHGPTWLYWASVAFLGFAAYRGTLALCRTLWPAAGWLTIPGVICLWAAVLVLGSTIFCRGGDDER